MVLIIFVTYWSVYPYKVLLQHAPHKILTPIVYSGESMKYRRVVTKLMDIQGSVSCSIVDGIEYKLPQRISTTKLGLNDSIQILVIPNQIETGTYRYACDVTFDVNPIRKITYHTTTEKFKVIQLTESGSGE